VQLEARYARLGRDRIAYQTVGDGPLVLVNAPGSFSHADVVFEDPAAVLYYRRLASFAKVIHFDRRGTGGSDPAPADARPPWEPYVEELTAVLDAAGVEQTALLAMFDVGPMAISFAATRPRRVAALILANTSARHLAADDYPIGIPPGGRRDDAVWHGGVLGDGGARAAACAQPGR
jgi:pimeloyl-ACP methyl ester carboxylesterase